MISDSVYSGPQLKREGGLPAHDSKFEWQKRKKRRGEKLNVNEEKKERERGKGKI